MYFSEMDYSDGKQQRAYIEAHVKGSSDIDYKALSKAIGKNATYIQQFITKGSPRALRERDMAVIVGTIEGGASDTPDVLNIPVYGFRAGMGGGGVVLNENPTSLMPVHKDYLRNVRLDNAELIAIEVEGDSMSPTLITGDNVLINKKDRNPARGGMFAIFDSNTLVVKRIEKIPATDPVMLRLISDNAHHSSYDVIADDTNIIGRIVWFARRI